MKETISLSVIVPVYNEEYLLEESLNRLFVITDSPYISKVQVVVVDDASNDGTVIIIEKLSRELPSKNGLFNWCFIKHEQNKGKGEAIKTALQFLTGDITIIHDADLEYFPSDITRMIPLFITEHADAVYGSRFLPHEYRRVLMFRHELGNRLITFLSNLFSNLNLTDVETCYKAIKTDLLKSIPLHSADFRFEIEITMKLAKRKARIFEMPITYSGRTYEEGKKIKWPDGFKALWAIIKYGFSDDIFTEDNYGGRILARLSEAEKFNRWMVDMFIPYVGQNVLEIGAGIGTVTKKVIPRKRYYATDINEYYLTSINSLKENKPYLNVTYLNVNDVASFKKTQGHFDTIICLNVIEHVDDDALALRNIADLLENNGRAVILVPRGAWLFGSLDEVVGHRRRYSKKMLESLAQTARLDIITIIPFNRISVIPWYLNGKVLKKRTFGLFQIYVMNHLTPLLRVIDKFIPLPSLSFIAIMEKKPQP